MATFGEARNLVIQTEYISAQINRIQRAIDTLPTQNAYKKHISLASLPNAASELSSAPTTDLSTGPSNTCFSSCSTLVSSSEPETRLHCRSVTSSATSSASSLAIQNISDSATTSTSVPKQKSTRAIARRRAQLESDLLGLVAHFNDLSVQIALHHHDHHHHMEQFELQQEGFICDQAVQVRWPQSAQWQWDGRLTTMQEPFMMATCGKPLHTRPAAEDVEVSHTVSPPSMLANPVEREYVGYGYHPPVELSPLTSGQVL